MNIRTTDQGEETREKIFYSIVGYITVHGYPPTVREIADNVGMKSTSSVYNHLKKMIKEGILETDAPWGTPRAIRVPGYSFCKGRYSQVEGYTYNGNPLYVREEV